MIIVSGKLYVSPESRQAFLLASEEAVTIARQFPGCRDFVVAADPLEPDRVNVYEEWESEEALLSFRGEGPDDDMESAIVRAKINQYFVATLDSPL